MSNITCLRFGNAAQYCGVAGTCVNDTICECRNGWSKSTEFAFYLNQEEFDIGNSNGDPNTNNLICDLKPELLKGLYGLAFSLTLASLIYQLRFVKKKKQVRKLSAYLVCSIVGMVFCLIRMFRLDKEIGEDVFVTFLWTVTHISGNISVLWFNERFISYQAKSSSRTRTPKYSPKNLQRVQRLLTFSHFLYGTFFFSISLVKAVTSKRRLFLTSLGIYSISCFYQIWAVGYLISYIIQDFNYILNEDSDAVHVMANDQFIKSIETSKRGLRILYFCLTSYTLLMMIFYFMPIVSNSGYATYKYYIPLQLLVGMVWAIIVLAVWKHTKREGPNSKKKPTGNYTFGKRNVATSTVKSFGTSMKTDSKDEAEDPSI